MGNCFSAPKVAEVGAQVAAPAPPAPAQVAESGAHVAAQVLEASPAPAQAAAQVPEAAPALAPVAAQVPEAAPAPVAQVLPVQVAAQVLEAAPAPAQVAEVGVQVDPQVLDAAPAPAQVAVQVREAAPGPSQVAQAGRAFYDYFDRIGVNSGFLGKGTSGVTFRCREKSSGLQFACKRINKGSSTPRELLLNEIEILHLLQHSSSHIVNIHDTFESGSHIFIVMELCPGGELFYRLADRGRRGYGEREAARLMAMIADAVQCCHSHNVIHRDLKPENFLFYDSQPLSPLKLVDFDLSVIRKPGEVFNEMVGTPCYMAPEVVQKSNYGPTADVWSAGCILYCLLSGYPPFYAENKDEVITKVLNPGVLDLFSEDPWPQLSNDAKDLVSHMLDRSPEKRFTAAQVCDHRWIRQDAGAPDRSLDPAVLTRIREFLAMSKMKKIAMRFIAENQSEEEIAGLKTTFEMLDVHKNGTITIENLKEGFEKMSGHRITIADDELRRIMEAVDMSKTGSIDIKEFLAATLQFNKLFQRNRLADAFDFFDTDKSGFITLDDLKRACLDHKINEAAIQDLLEKIDKDNDGKIDYNQFVSMMYNNNGGPV